MQKKRRPGLGEAEAEVLNIVWSKGSATVQQVWEALPPDRAIAQATVQSMLRRLRDKGYLKSQARGRMHVFSAAAQPNTVVRDLVRRFVRGLFGGDPLPLLMHLAENHELSREDLQRLRKAVDEAEESGEADERD